MNRSPGRLQLTQTHTYTCTDTSWSAHWPSAALGKQLWEPWVSGLDKREYGSRNIWIWWSCNNQSACFAKAISKWQNWSEHHERAVTDSSKWIWRDEEKTCAGIFERLSFLFGPLKDVIWDWDVQTGDSLPFKYLSQHSGGGKELVNFLIILLKDLFMQIWTPLDRQKLLKSSAFLSI